MSPSTTIPQVLTDEQVQFFHDNGYLLIENALDAETIAGLKERTKTLLEDFSLDGHPMTKFSTGEKGNKHVGDQYFLESGDKVRFFFEEDAFDSTGNLTRPKEKSINKIGHGLHTEDAAFRAMTLTPQNLSIALSLGFKDPRVLQSMIICKQPEIGGEVGSHQDSPFLFTNPPSAMGFWYALEDCTITNGCLGFIPASHKYSPITNRLVRINGGADGTGFENIPETWPADVPAPHPTQEEREKLAEEKKYQLAEVKAGTLVLIHGSVLHKSERNRSLNSRWIYTFHMIEGEYEYDAKNWLQPSEGGFSRLRDVVERCAQYQYFAPSHLSTPPHPSATHAPEGDATGPPKLQLDIQTVRSFNGSTTAFDKRTLPWRRPVVFLGVNDRSSLSQVKRWYSKDAGLEDDDARMRELERLENGTGEDIEPYEQPEDEDLELFIDDLDDPSQDIQDDPNNRQRPIYPYQRHKPEHPDKLNYVYIADPDLEDETLPPRDVATQPPVPRKVAAELADPTRAPDWTRTLGENRQLRRKPQVTRASLVRDLERMNARLARGGLGLVEPRRARRRDHVVTRPETITDGYEESIWQKFKVDYSRRFRSGDPTVFLGRPEGWKPTRGELKIEYTRFFWEHVGSITEWYAQRRHWWNAPDLRLCFANSLFMLERFTSPETIAKYRFRGEPFHKLQLAEVGGSLEAGEKRVPLDDLAQEMRGELLALEPDSYQLIETTVRERDTLMSSMKNWTSSGLLPNEIDEFRLEYLGQIDLEGLAKVFRVNVEKKLPLSSNKLLALIQSLTSLKISKQDIRYLLPPGYTDSVEFISSTIVSLILSHEQNKVLNTQIFNAAINYLMRANQVKKGRHLIDLMDHLKIRMNAGTFREGLLSAAKHKDLFVFERLLRRLMQKRIKFDHETWKALMLCCHTPGQQIQVLQTMKKIGLDPKRIAPGQLISLSFKIYRDQLKHGNINAPVPWKNLAGIHLDASTLNPILEFLYENYAYDDARTLFDRASKQLRMQPNYGTMRIIVRQARVTGTIIPMVRAIRIFEDKFGIRAEGDIMQMIFQQAHRFRYYNVVRTVWAHACLRNLATKGMIDRMRADIYETGRSAGKPGKLALGVCSEDTEAVVKTPVWAMRLISKARDPLGYLASEGGVYRNMEFMRDLKDVKEREKAMRIFEKRVIRMRMELLRMDLSSHQKFKPRRSFSADLVTALRRDLFLRKKHPQCHDWSMLTWAWSLFQVRRVGRDDNIGQILAWERVKKRQEAAKKEGRIRDEEMIWAKNYALMNNMPTHLSLRWLDHPSMSAPPIDSPSRIIPDIKSLSQADIQEFEREKEEEKRMMLAEREMGGALSDAIDSWKKPPIPYEDEENRNEEEEGFFWDDHDKVNTDRLKRNDAVREADVDAQIRADFEAAYQAALPKDDDEESRGYKDTDDYIYDSTKEM
ncbi:hypothetical protein TWF106_004613 [Orbilia oligospora]|uniref:Phytanoyl-CoA dioxygenase n=1 Tax=Orbilia oligospora TaxID=2813651 RepID=A0A7C8UL19_ORBOL|nr:hypothetical protein TWF106_004613 [Orbilia oligospora]KAF3208544.1 hypothetical protein TWF191_000608 [Orbilia oligospora]